MNRIIKWLFLLEDTKKCKNCRAELKKKWKACPECGMSVSAKAVPQQVTVPYQPVVQQPVYYPPQQVVYKSPPTPKNGTTSNRKKKPSFKGVVYIAILIGVSIWVISWLEDHQTPAQETIEDVKKKEMTPEEMFKTSFLLDEQLKNKKTNNQWAEEVIINDVKVRVWRGIEE